MHHRMFALQAQSVLLCLCLHFCTSLNGPSSPRCFAEIRWCGCWNWIPRIASLSSNLFCASRQSISISGERDREGQEKRQSRVEGNCWVERRCHTFYPGGGGKSLNATAERDNELYRAEKKSLKILLSSTQAGPCRKVKQEQEEISRNHVPRLFLGSVYVRSCGEVF